MSSELNQLLKPLRDSIDAIDLVVKIKELTGKQVNPEDFKNVRTVQDVVVVIQNMSAA